MKPKEREVAGMPFRKPPRRVSTGPIRNDDGPHVQACFSSRAGLWSVSYGHRMLERKAELFILGGSLSYLPKKRRGKTYHKLTVLGFMGELQADPALVEWSPVDVKSLPRFMDVRLAWLKGGGEILVLI